MRMLAAKRERKAATVAKGSVEVAEGGKEVAGAVELVDVEVVGIAVDGDGVELEAEEEGRLRWVPSFWGGDMHYLILACPGDVGARETRDGRHSKYPVDEGSSRHGQDHETCMIDEEGHL